MIFDRIENRAAYASFPGLARALDYLAGLTLENGPAEKTQLDGDNLIYNPLSLPTKPAEDCVFETHRTYIDVHYTLSGQERITIGNPLTATETKAYSEENDTAYYTCSAASSCVSTPGCFMVCFPWDIHRTVEQVESSCDLRKVVMKVKMP